MAQMKRRIAGLKAKYNGKAFEQRLEAEFEYYRLSRAALIEKTPEPVKQLSGMDKAGRFSACYEKRAQPDYKGVLRGGTCIVIEAKYTSGDRIALKRVEPHQIDRLTEYQGFGALSFVVIGFGDGSVYRVPSIIWISEERLGRSSYKKFGLEDYRVPEAGGRLFLLEDIT